VKCIYKIDQKTEVRCIRFQRDNISRREGKRQGRKK
jgi:hypothetical protein